MEIDAKQHPDFIWTWASTSRTKKVSLWLPYLQRITRLPKGKSDRYTFEFNGGSVTCHLKELDFLMLYGAAGVLPVEFLDKLATYNIPLMIHRRNMPNPLLFFPAFKQSSHDLLTHQILYRENLIRRTYIARTLIALRLRSLQSTVALSGALFNRLRSGRTLETVRVIEAQATKRYWKAYYHRLGLEGINRRDTRHPVNAALDACSYFMFGVLLRWIIFHRLSPCHAFLHEPVTYPSLCYDLMEPYRHWFEHCVTEAVAECEDPEHNLTGLALSHLKVFLEQEVYVHETRQRVYRKNLLHGIVLALRAYLLGESKRFIVPIEGKRIGGRPLKVGYRLPGGR